MDCCTRKTIDSRGDLDCDAVCFGGFAKQLSADIDASLKR